MTDEEIDAVLDSLLLARKERDEALAAIERVRALPLRPRACPDGHSHMRRCSYCESYEYGIMTAKSALIQVPRLTRARKEMDRPDPSNLGSYFSVIGRSAEGRVGEVDEPDIDILISLSPIIAAQSRGTEARDCSEEHKVRAALRRPRAGQDALDEVPR